MDAKFRDKSRSREPERCSARRDLAFGRASCNARTVGRAA